MPADGSALQPSYAVPEKARRYRAMLGMHHHTDLGLRFAAVVGSVLFLVVAPGTLVVLLPFRISHWRVAPPLVGFVGFRVLGVLLMAAGLPVLLDSFARFALKGLGTPAPIAPPARLVVTGLYGHVRNPIYVAVTSLIVGQALVFGDVGLLEYGLGVWAFFYIWVLAIEEPVLRAKFGAEYQDFCAHVRRWIPRLEPWRGPS
jgi:protein-S-isoprenylcysteine O-methyltransferase Ste14